MIEKKKSSAVLVFNDKGELALQLRSSNDDSFPSHWDFSAGGGIDSGESIVRERPRGRGTVRERPRGRGPREGGAQGEGG